jgi:RimJ/RimL family protein N-acetyltransferase
MDEVGVLGFRRPEPRDVEALFVFKNDPVIAALLTRSTRIYSKADLEKWVEFHRDAADEALFMVTDSADRPIGHVGLYKIDQQTHSAEFAILIGAPRALGRGFGRTSARFAIDHGFDELGLHRIYLDVLATNERAIRLYRSLGFVEEGRLREAQIREGNYVDVLVMGLLSTEYRRATP